MSQKTKWGNLLLLSLIPLGLLGFGAFFAYVISISFTSDPTTNSEIESPWEVFWAFAVFLLWPVWWLALVAGIVLRVWGGHQTRRIYREARQYAELHGWQQISDTAFKSFKRNNLIMTVSQAFEKPTYILSVEQEGETVATDGFSRSYYALRFADYLWEHVVSVQSRVDISVLQETRRDWERRMPELTSGR